MCTTVSPASNRAALNNKPVNGPVNNQPPVHTEQGKTQTTVHRPPSNQVNVRNVRASEVHETVSPNISFPAGQRGTEAVSETTSVNNHYDHGSHVGIRFVNNHQSTRQEIDTLSHRTGPTGPIGQCTPNTTHATATTRDVYFYANGINNNETQTRVTAGILHNLTGHDIHLLHNTTDGMVPDAAEAMQVRSQSPTMGRPPNHTELYYQREIYRALVNGEKPKIIAHSEGAILVANALQLVKDRLLHEGRPAAEMMRNVNVVTMGGFANPTDFPNDVQLVQMSDPRDPVPFVAGNLFGSSKPSELYRLHQATGQGDTGADIRGTVSDRAVGAHFRTQLAVTAGIGALVTGHNPMAPHYVNENYLAQQNVRNFFAEFGREDIDEMQHNR
jgi:hypothetical protein